jgi:membrane protease subunit HflK
MDVNEWQRRTRSVVDVGRFPRFSLKGRGGLVRTILIALVALIALVSTYYQVNADEVAVVQRFGRYVRTTEPGPHLKIPFIERVTRVPVQRQLKAEFGFRTTVPGVRSAFVENDVTRAESLMLTGDLNVAVVEWIVQYKVKDPYKYLFKVRNLDTEDRRGAGSTFRDMNEAVMRMVVGDHSVNEVLTVGREDIQIDAKNKLQELCNRYETGLEVLQIVLQDVNPPDLVKPAFNEVNEARQQMERMINEAQEAYNREVPKATGEGKRLVTEAEGYANEQINRAQGEAKRFTEVLAAYQQAKDVTQRRFYLDAMQAILGKAARVWVVDDSVKGLLPLMSLGKDGKTAPAPAAKEVRQ